jgi:hypothetical protein
MKAKLFNLTLFLTLFPFIHGHAESLDILTDSLNSNKSSEDLKLLHLSETQSITNVSQFIKKEGQNKFELKRLKDFQSMYSGDFGAGNGGDSCERRIKEIRSDLNNWLSNDGGDELQLPSQISSEEYKLSMLRSIEEGLINCTESEIKIGSSSKTCRNFVNRNNDLVIECNSSRFLKISEDEQYRLIHHEFAGLAGFEINMGTGKHYEESNYEISDQLASFLEYKKVKKLSIQQCSSENMDTKRYKRVEKFFISEANSKNANVIKDKIDNLVHWEGSPSNIDSNNHLTTDSISIIELYSEYSYVADERRSYKVFLKLDKPSLPIHADDYVGNYTRHDTLAFSCELESKSPCANKVIINCMID